MLLAGAGFMMRSFLNMYRFDPGFETSRLLTMSIILPARKYPSRDDQLSILRRIEERLNTVGAIEGATTSTSMPMGGAASRQLAIDGRSGSPGDKPATVTMVSAGPHYFDALGVKLLRGRRGPRMMALRGTRSPSSISSSPRRISAPRIRSASGFA